MKKLVIGLVIISFNFVLLQDCAKGKKMHEKTDWHLEPSMKYDILCFLNALTGDSFYLRYYQDEYKKFRPKLTPVVQSALEHVKKKIKDENKGIISALLCLYFSATDDQTLDDMLMTLENSTVMQNNLKSTPYYNDKSWQLYESVRDDLKVIFQHLKAIDFEIYWQENIRPKVEQKIVDIQETLPKYNIIKEVESHLGFSLSSNIIVVYMLYYTQPHGIKITGTRFLTDVAWPFKIVLRNAVHEMMHPPYDLANDDELRETLSLLKEDEFLMDKVLHHNPAYGYNTFEGFIEEDCVQALEQIINEKLAVEQKAHKRWKECDGGMHIFAVALYSLMKEEEYNKKNETFRDFLIRMIESGRLMPGKIKIIYDAFYEENIN